MSRFTNLNTSCLILTLSLCFFNSGAASGTAIDQLIRGQILKNGFIPSKDLYTEKDKNLIDEGEIFFESKDLSLNGNIACATCHMRDLASVDGIPNAVGVRGHGEGLERLMSGGKIVPRNSLALWGIGAPGMGTLFWDGKLIFKDGQTISQFGSTAPSNDPLITAVHLPAVEIRETLEEDAFIRRNKNESVQGVDVIYSAIVDNLRVKEGEAMSGLASKLNRPVENLKFIDVATALAAFIRSEFRIRETILEKFVRGDGSLTQSEKAGAIIFYGKGGCASCHSGPNFTDQNFYTVPFPQLGFGKNGFGIDYGRYNATFNPKDLYKFRTPSLYNIDKTGPYGHSGSLNSLSKAITAHYDPLRLINVSDYDALKRHELAKVLASSDMVGKVGFLTDDEVTELTEFLKTLSF